MTAHTGFRRLLPSHISSTAPKVNYSNLLREQGLPSVLPEQFGTDDAGISQHLQSMRQAREAEPHPLRLRITLADLRRQPPEIPIENSALDSVETAQCNIAPPPQTDAQLSHFLKSILPLLAALPLAAQSDEFDLEALSHQAIRKAQVANPQILLDFDRALPQYYRAKSEILEQIFDQTLAYLQSQNPLAPLLLRLSAPQTPQSDGQQTLHISFEANQIGVREHQLCATLDALGVHYSCQGNRYAITTDSYTMWLEAEDSKGLTLSFQLELPASIGRDRLLGASARVLIMDERFISRTILERQLKALGHEVITTRSPIELQTLILTLTPPDVVLLDQANINSPICQELTLMLRRAGWAMPIYTLSPECSAQPFMLQKPLTHQMLNDLIPQNQIQARPKILILESNLTHQLILEKMLRDYDCECIFTTQSVDTLSRFEQIKPDMVLLEHHLTHHDARKTARMLRIHPHGAKSTIIALTLSTDETTPSAWEDANSNQTGLNHWLAKPLRRSSLGQVLQKYLPHLSPSADHAAG